MRKHRSWLIAGHPSTRSGRAAGSAVTSKVLRAPGQPPLGRSCSSSIRASRPFAMSRESAECRPAIGCGPLPTRVGYRAGPNTREGRRGPVGPGLSSTPRAGPVGHTDAVGTWGENMIPAALPHGRRVELKIVGRKCQLVAFACLCPAAGLAGTSATAAAGAAPRTRAWYRHLWCLCNRHAQSSRRVRWSGLAAVSHLHFAALRAARAERGDHEAHKPQSCWVDLRHERERLRHCAQLRERIVRLQLANKHAQPRGRLRQPGQLRYEPGGNSGRRGRLKRRRFRTATAVAHALRPVVSPKGTTRK